MERVSLLSLIFGQKPPDVSCRSGSESERHFRVYLSRNRTDLDETWQRDEKWGKSDAVKFSARSLQGPRKRGTKTTVWSLPRFTEFDETQR